MDRRRGQNPEASREKSNEEIQIIDNSDEDVVELSSSFDGRQSNESADDSSDVPDIPVGIFAELGRCEMNKTLVDDSILGPLYQCNGLNFFQSKSSLGDILVQLMDPVTADLYGNPGAPIKFQGSAYCAVKLRDHQRSYALDLISKDRNGTWHPKTKLFPTVDHDGETICYLRRYYSNTQCSAKRVIAFFVERPGSEVMARSNMALIWFYWSNKVVPSEIPCGKERSSRSITDQLRKEVKLSSRGAGISPMQAFKNLCDTVDSSGDNRLNPFYRPKDVRQAVYAKQAEKRSVFGDSLEFLLGNPKVLSRQLVIDGQTVGFNFLIAEPYQLKLFPALAGAQFRGILFCDTTFDMGDKFVTTTVMEHPMFVNYSTGGRALLQMPSFMTPSLKQESYEQFVWWLKESASDLEQLLLITDGEKALYNAFIKVFRGCVHGICAIHSRRNVSDKLRTLKDLDATVRKQILIDIYGFVDSETKTRQPGLIDSESVELFQQQLEKCRDRWSAPESNFYGWFVRYQKCVFEDKLILPVRQKLGLDYSLAHTNDCEAYHSKFKRLIGTVKDPKQVVMGLLKLAEEQKNDMVSALVGQGPFRLRPEFQRLKIQESRIHDKKYVKQQQTLLFFGDPGATFLTDGTYNDEPNLPLRNIQEVPDPAELHSVYKEMLQKGREFVKTHSQSIVEGPSSSNNGDDIYKIVIRPDMKNICYHVKISTITGESSCTCDMYKTGRLKFCEHVAAVASKEGVTEKVLLGYTRKQDYLRNLLLASPKRGKKQNAYVKRLSTGHTQRNEMTVLPNILQFDEYENGSSGFVGNTSAKEQMPWELSKAKFIVTKELITNPQVKCAGCSEHMADTENKALLDMVVTHIESDYKKGTKEIAKPRLRRYHLRNSCVQRRHQRFDPTKKGIVICDAKWYKHASIPEKEMAKMFTEGRITW